MNAGKIVGIILIVASLFVGYMGINKIAANDASIEILGAELDLSNKSGKQQGYIFLGVAVILFGGGLYSLSKK